MAGKEKRVTMSVTLPHRAASLLQEYAEKKHISRNQAAAKLIVQRLKQLREQKNF